jgi:hypothetical protein
VRKLCEPLALAGKSNQLQSCGVELEALLQKMHWTFSDETMAKP